MSRSSKSSSRTLYALLAVLTIVAGLVLRRVPLGLPFLVVKYGGSMLWAAMIYWIFAAISPASRPARLGVFAAIFATLIEFFKLYHSPGLNAFRRTLLGSLLLGRYFSLWDIAAYCFGIWIVASLDFQIIRR